MCSISTPSSLTEAAGGLFDENPAQLIGEVRQQFPRARWPERFDYEYRRNGAVNLSSSSTPTAGAGSRSLVVAPPTTSPACASSSMSTSRSRAHPRRPRQPLHPHRRRSLRRLPTGRGAPRAQAARVPLHAQHAAGSTWSRSRSACSKANVSIAASKAATASLPRSTPGRPNETKAALESPGCSPPGEARTKMARACPTLAGRKHSHCAMELVRCTKVLTV